VAELNRLFFALWPTEAVRRAADEAARGLRMKMQPGGYLSAPERYHVTLLFLGDTVPAAQEAAARAAAAKLRAAPFELQLDLASSFPRNREIPWWLGPRETPAALSAFYEALREQMVAGGVTPERLRFVPHLTILRNARLALPPTPITPIPWRVDEFVLVRSRLDLKPVEYELLERWPLRGAEPPPPPPQLSLWG
jgi:2'-5' RNA ligase